MKLKIAVIGLGYWGPQILRNLYTIPNLTIIGCEIDKSKREKFRLLYPSVKFLESTKTLYADTSLSGVIIATPPSTHYSLAKQALENNLDVLVEKPMTKTVDESKSLLSLARRRKRILMTGHTFIYTNAVRLIKKLLIKQSLGKIYYYDSTRINLGILQNDSNVIEDLAVHDLSILDYLFAEKPSAIQVLGSSHVINKQAETGHIFISYPSGMTAHIHVSWLSPVKIRQIYIGGSKKMILYDDVEPSEKIRIYEKSITLDPKNLSPFAPLYRSGKVVIPHIPQQEALKNELLHFISCIRDRKQPLSDGEAGLRVVRLLSAANQSLEKGERITLSW